MILPKPGDNKREPSDTDFFLASSLGLVLVISIAIGLGTGVYLDRVFKSRPVCPVIFLILGIAAGFWQIVKEIIRLNASGKRKDSR